MNIGCTKKLLDELKLKPGDSAEENPLFSWHANLLLIHRRKAVLLVNDKTRYSSLLFGLKASNFRSLGKLITAAIRETLLAEGILPEVVELYMKEAGEITFTNTTSKSVLAHMNQLARITQLEDPQEYDTDNLNQIDFNLRMADYPLKIEGFYKYPRELFIKNLMQLAKDEGCYQTTGIISVESYQFLVTLCLENHKVWRRIIVPADITFRKFHFAIQSAVGWRDCHLHEFQILDKSKTIAGIVSSEEELDNNDITDFPVELDIKTKLSKYLPEFSHMIYVYDYGDYWEHHIQLEKVIADYQQNYPACIEGEGNCPPEDVGGEGGYEAFLEVMNDPNHPDYFDLLSWSRTQLYSDFDIEKVNWRLDSSLYKRNYLESY